MLRLLGVSITMVLLVTACSPQSPLHYPRRVFLPQGYQRDIPQGNILTPALVAELQPGMRKTDVRRLLGTPTLQVPFRDNVWVYLNDSRLGDGSTIYARLTLTFADDETLQRIDSEGLDAATTTHTD